VVVRMFESSMFFALRVFLLYLYSLYSCVLVGSSPPVGKSGICMLCKKL
jgi:hypothetical protein